MKINLDDTIAAVATPIGEAGIGIVRLSGRDALSIADRIFVSRDGKRPSEYGTYTMHYGHIVDGHQSPCLSGRQAVTLPVRQAGSHQSKDRRQATGDRRHDTIDEVLLTVMKAPKSYTKEDIVEINCHGGIAPLKKVLDLVLHLGARLAEPGEFTKRAFLNGRIDLAQAEAVLDIIRAKTEKGLEIALLQLEGGVSDSIRGLKEKLFDINVHLEASVDFPEEGLSVYSHRELESGLEDVKREMEGFLKSFETGRIMREGINCVICGKANVGKSSLMNEFLKEDRVIVTPIPGTTRDAVCEYINIEGIPMNIVDTAGISETKDPLEKEGIRKSRFWIDKADLVLFMMDASAGFSDGDRDIIELIKAKEVISVVNKIDLAAHININPDALKAWFGKETPLVEISVLKNTNLNALFKAISDKVWKGGIFANDFNILTNARHKDSVLKALAAVTEAQFSLREKEPEEIIAISLNEAVSALGEITGEEISKEVLDRIFGQFCIGK